MNIEIRSLIEKGDLERERLTLRVLKDADVGDFLVMRSGHNGEDVTTDIHNAFWFPYAKVESGDLVVLYTKSGSIKSRPLTTGKTAHFFYWGLVDPIWATSHVSAILLFAPDWQGRPARDL